MNAHAHTHAAIVEQQVYNTSLAKHVSLNVNCSTPLHGGGTEVKKVVLLLDLLNQGSTRGEDVHQSKYVKIKI